MQATVNFVTAGAALFGAGATGHRGDLVQESVTSESGSVEHWSGPLCELN